MGDLIARVRRTAAGMVLLLGGALWLPAHGGVAEDYSVTGVLQSWDYQLGGIVVDGRRYRIATTAPVVARGQAVRPAEVPRGTTVTLLFLNDEVFHVQVHDDQVRQSDDDR